MAASVLDRVLTDYPGVPDQEHTTSQEGMRRCMAHGRIHELIDAENRGDTAPCVFDDWALEQCRFWVGTGRLDPALNEVPYSIEQCRCRRSSPSMYMMLLPDSVKIEKEKSRSCRSSSYT
jgi:hypothetical protein